jgi:hypothetical protein
MEMLGKEKKSSFEVEVRQERKRHSVFHIGSSPTEEETREQGTAALCHRMDIGDADNKELARYHFNTEGKREKGKIRNRQTNECLQRQVLSKITRYDENIQKEKEEERKNYKSHCIWSRCWMSRQALNQKYLHYIRPQSRRFS